MPTLIPVFELPGGRGWGLNPPTVFSTLLTHCQIMYWGVRYIYYIHTIYITILVELLPSKSSTLSYFFSQFKHCLTPTFDRLN